MSEFIWYGTVLGAILGAFHFLHILFSRLGQPGTNLIGTLWQGLWTWALWTLFGAYVLAFWLLGLVLYLIFGRTKAAAVSR